MSAKKSGNVPLESDDIKSYTVPVSNIDDIESNPNIIALKNKHGEMRKLNRPCVICFLKFLKLKNPEEHYLRLLQLYKPWKNESELKLRVKTTKVMKIDTKRLKMILCAT